MPRVRNDDTQQAKLLLPEYDKAWQELVQRVVLGYSSADELMGELARVDTGHSGPIRNVKGETPLDHPMADVEFSAAMGRNVVRQGCIEDHTIFLHEMATAHLSATKPKFFERLGEIVEAAGNVVDGGGRPFSWDLWLDMLERVDVQFDKNDEPVMPLLSGHLGEGSPNSKTDDR